MVFVTGGTGFLGRALISRLLADGRGVRALSRAGSGRKLPPGVEVVAGNPFDAHTFQGHIEAGDTVVQLLGTSKPSPWKGREFEQVDRASALATISAAREARAGHFVYVSVAHPAPIMRAYIRVRVECERALAESGLAHTILRPWYVLGPGRRWPYAIAPIYKLLEAIPATREGAERLGMVSLEQMADALAEAVRHPPERARVIEVPGIRAARGSR